MTLPQQMTQAASTIHPQKTLAQLCQPTTLGKPRSHADRLAIYRILRSGNIYLTPGWISQFFPISVTALRHIAKDLRHRESA
jgi:hypothetical protein